MKKIRNLLFVVCLLISLGVFTSCKKKVETSGTGYGIVHKDYVGVASIKVKDEKVTSLSFEEVYLPENWAQVSDSIDENLYFKATGSHGELTSAKYLVIGDKNFTGSVDSDNAPVYSAEGITNLKTWINTSEDNAKWYATNVLDGKAKVSDAQFKDVTFDYYGKTTGFTKSATNYWPAGSVGLGWKKNMEELANTLVGSKMNFDETKIVLDENSKTWKFDQIQSKATLVDAKDYYQVAKRAYNAATKK